MYDAETSADIPWRRLRGDEELALAAGLESRKSEKVSYFTRTIDKTRTTSWELGTFSTGVSTGEATGP